VAKLCFPKAKVSADPFHVVKNLTKCFQEIRINTMKKYTHLKDEGSNYYWLFKKFWKFLLIDISKLPDTQIRVSKSGSYMSKYKIIEYMLTISEKLSKAYYLKEDYRNFVATATIETAENELNMLITKFKDAHIPEYSSFIKLMYNWHDEIINSFNRINGHKITNGPMERINRDIKLLFGVSFGSTNFTRVRNRIMFALNEDAPILAKKKTTTNKKIGKPRGKYKK
jgi:transposase